MNPMQLNFIGGLYDRILPLFTGEVTVDGFDLRIHPVDSPREVFDRMARNADYDLSEMSSAEYVMAAARGGSPFVALPVFLSKVFRHGFIFVNAKARIEDPKDLAGKRIGVPLYTQSAAVWIRGILKTEYGVDLSGVRWVQGALNQAGRYGDPKILPLLKPIDLEAAPEGRSLDDMLVAGELDAVIGAEVPASLGRSPSVRRLFPDYREREKDYFRRTGIFPIMHLVILRREVQQRHPTAGQAIYDALCRAKAVAMRKMRDVSATRYMLPWLASDIEELDALFGADHWSYGIEANRRTLEQFVHHLVDQNMIPAPVPVDSLFLPVSDALAEGQGA